MDLFSVDAAQEFETRKASRHAAVLAHTRVTERYAGFLDAAASNDERALRYSLIEGDVNRTVQAACEECGCEDVEAITAAVEQHLAAGGFCDDCRKWKSGPKAGCTCGDGKPDKKDDDGDSDDKSDKDDGGNPFAKKDDSDDGEDKSDDGDGDSNPFASSVKTAEDSLGGKGKPSPKMDKGNAGDERGHKKRKPINTDGGRYKTDRQDVADRADLADQDFLKQTETVTDHDVDVTKGSETSGINGGGPTKTWSGKGGQADPVTSRWMSSDQIRTALAPHEEGLCPECGATTFGGVCSDPNCVGSQHDLGEGHFLHPHEYGGPRDPQADGSAGGPVSLPHPPQGL